MCAICHRAFATSNKLLYHMTMHLDMSAPACDGCQQPRSMILTPLFVCGKGCMKPLTAPVYDVPHPRPLTPNVEATCPNLEDINEGSLFDEPLSFENLMDEVMSLENDQENLGNISDTGYMVMSPRITPTDSGTAPVSAASNGAHLSAENSPEEGPIYSELEPVRTLSLTDATKWAVDSDVTTSVSLPWDSSWSSADPPATSTPTQIYTIKTGSTPVASKIKQFMVKLTPARPGGSQSPKAVKPNKPAGLARIGSVKNKRSYALLPRYGRGMDRHGNNVCLYCNMTFTDRAILDTHIVSTHTTRFMCPLCQADLLPTSVKRHMVKVHPTLFDEKKQVLDNLITMLQHKKTQYNW